MSKDFRNQPLVSVIIPTFNRKRELCRALNSVIAQDYPDLEVIVVDDCSSDGTVEWLSNTHFSIRVKVIPMEANRGQSVARNVAIAAAIGKYVAFLDSDDHWMPNKLRQQISILEAYPQNTVIFSQAYIRRKHVVVLRPVARSYALEPLDSFLFVDKGFMPLSSVVLSRQLAQAVKFRSEIRLHEDWDFFLRLESHGAKFVMCQQALCIIEDDSQINRASGPRPDLSLRWLEARKHRLSRAAYLSLRASIAPQLRNEKPLTAAWFIMEAVINRAIGAWTLLILLGRLVHPALRELAYWVQGFTMLRRGITPLDATTTAITNRTSCR